MHHAKTTQTKVASNLWNFSYSKGFKMILLFVLVYVYVSKRTVTRGRVLGRNQDKSLKSFPPYYSKSPLLTGWLCAGEHPVEPRCPAGWVWHRSNAGRLLAGKRFYLECLIFKLFPGREILVCDIPAGDWKTANLFYSVIKYLIFESEMVSLQNLFFVSHRLSP
jgi:hypothetical protein